VDRARWVVILRWRAPSRQYVANRKREADMDFVSIIVPLLLAILCVQIGIVTLKLESIISLLKTRE
jgi:hypothetical protein